MSDSDPHAQNPSLKTDWNPRQFVIAQTYTNDTGHRAFVFSNNPFVHNGAHSVEQEARRLANANENHFAVFGLLYTVRPEVEVENFSVDAEVLAANLAAEMNSKGFGLKIGDARKMVTRALKQALNSGLEDPL